MDTYYFNDTTFYSVQKYFVKENVISVEKLKRIKIISSERKKKGRLKYGKMSLRTVPEIEKKY